MMTEMHELGMPHFAEGEANAKDVLDAFARGAESAGDLSEMAPLGEMLLVVAVNKHEDIGSYLAMPMPAFAPGRIQSMLATLSQEMHGAPVYAGVMFITGSSPEYHSYMEERMKHVTDIEAALEMTREMSNMEEAMKKMGAPTMKPCIMMYIACGADDYAAGMVVLNDDKEFESFHYVEVPDPLSARSSFGSASSPDRHVLSALITGIEAAKEIGRSIEKLLGDGRET